MITDYSTITEKSNRLQVIMITDYDYPISAYKVSDLSTTPLGLLFTLCVQAVNALASL